MRRRSFIRSAIAGGLGLAALLRTRPAVTATEPKRLTVEKWAELNRIEKWEPIAVSYVVLPIFPSILEAKIVVDDLFGRANVYMRFDESENWTNLGPVERVTVEVQPPPPRLADRTRRFIVSTDDPELMPNLPSLARRRRSK